MLILNHNLHYYYRDNTSITFTITTSTPHLTFPLQMIQEQTRGLLAMESHSGTYYLSVYYQEFEYRVEDYPTGFTRHYITLKGKNYPLSKWQFNNIKNNTNNK